MFHALLLLCLQSAPLGARPEPKDMTIDAATRSAVIEEAAKDLDENYVFPDVAKKMSALLRQKRDQKSYDSLTSAKAFAKQLTDDLQSVSHDKHLRVRYEEQALAPIRDGDGDGSGPSRGDFDRYRAEAARNNFGFIRVERLEGNIGYIDFREFASAAVAGEKVTQVMNFVADTDALIFDIRENGGGAPDQVAWICSYLFGNERVHLNDLYFRPDDRTEQFWTTPTVPGRKYEGKDVYVLTSPYTFSGAEEFAYNLQTQKRATLVGETTGGGANPGGMSRLHDHFAMFLPMGRAINPITKTNWEGVGVVPDVKVAADRALAKAQVLALEKLIAAQPDVLPFERQEALKAQRARLDGASTKD